MQEAITGEHKKQLVRGLQVETRQQRLPSKPNQSHKAAVHAKSKPAEHVNNKVEAHGNERAGSEEHGHEGGEGEKK